MRKAGSQQKKTQVYLITLLLLLSMKIPSAASTPPNAGIVIKGITGTAKINNQAHISTSRLQKILSDIKSGEIITQRKLERVLLLLNDLAGIKAQTTLVPGQTAGTTDLNLNVSDTAKTSGNLYIDNWPWLDLDAA